jgi:hypothetical protein
MRRIPVLIASALINAATIPGLAAESALNKDVDAARAVSATVHSKPANDNEKTCRAYAASFYESEMLRQAADRVDGARMLTALHSAISAFNDLLATKCSS